MNLILIAAAEVSSGINIVMRFLRESREKLEGRNIMSERLPTGSAVSCRRLSTGTGQIAETEAADCDASSDDGS